MDTRFGTVAFYNNLRGFGFLTETSRDPTERCAEKYFHISNVVGRLVLKTGDRVQYQLKQSSHTGREEAIDIRLTTASIPMSDAGALDQIEKIDGGAR